MSADQVKATAIGLLQQYLITALVTIGAFIAFIAGRIEFESLITLLVISGVAEGKEHLRTRTTTPKPKGPTL